MDDRELLEMAAKAAGFEVRLFLVNGDADLGPFRERWNPLTDDGDALRLAVKLRLSTDFGDNGLSVYRHGETDFIRFTPYYDDAAAATRRAIVEAAAEIARATAQKG